MDAAIAATRRGQAGFTLIEVLVVVAVLSVLAVGASLTWGRFGVGAQEDATRFRAAFEAQRHLAVQGRQWRGLTPAARALRLHARLEDGWQQIGTDRRWRGRARFAEADLGPAPGAGLPAILFSPDGRTTAFSIVFTDGGRTQPVRCAADGWRDLTCKGG